MGLAGKAVSLKTIIRSRREEEKRRKGQSSTWVDAARRRAFFKERGETLRSLSPEERQPFLNAERQAGEANGHTLTISGVTMDDTPECSCGWKGCGYWDGADLAYAEWLWHLLGEGVPIKYPGG